MLVVVACCLLVTGLCLVFVDCWRSLCIAFYVMVALRCLLFLVVCLLFVVWCLFGVCRLLLLVADRLFLFVWYVLIGVS